MRIGMLLLRLLLCVGWVGLFIVSFRAVSAMGLDAGASVFFADLSHPWRAQYDTDLGLHLLVMGAWMIGRTRSLLLGLLSLFLAVNLGGLFTLAYILVVSFVEKGDLPRILLGWRAPRPA